MASGDFNHIQEAITALHDALAKAVAQAAQDVRDEAKAHAAVDTGYMRDHLYASTHESSGYQGGDKSLPEVPRPTSDLEAVAASEASYSLYVELGTSRMAAQPFMLPAAEAVRKRLPATVAEHISIELKTQLG